MASSETVQIFFPKSQVNKKGYLVGFNISGFQTTVIFIEENSDLKKLENVLNSSKALSNLIGYCGCKMVILGRIFEEGDEITEYCKQQMETYDLWIDIQYSENRKLGDKFKIKTLLCFGYKYKTKSQVIFYDKIQQNSLLSINPNKVKNAYSSFDIPHQFIESYYDQRNKQDNDSQLQEYFKKHIDVSDFDVNICQMEATKQDIFNNKYYQNLPELEYTIKQINFSNMINQIYSDELKALAAAEQNEQRDQASQQSNQEDENDINDKEHVYKKWLKPNKSILFFIQILVWCSSVQKLFYSLVYNLLSYKLPYLQKSLVDIKVGRNVFNQVKFKIEVMQSWPILLVILKHKHQSLKYSFVLKIYLRLLSGLTYIAIDTILGLFSILFIAFNVTKILGFIHQYFSGIHIDALSKEVEWLMSDPAGLKTNKNLNKIMGFLISNLFIFWNNFTTFATPFEPYLMRLIAFFGFFGISFELCIVNDIINILTLHVYIIYKMLMMLYREVMALIKMLYGVMKGKVLKNSNYEVSWDQKVLSMIFFFFLVSMFPTIAMYYFAYLLIVLVVYITKVSLNTTVHMLNTFPAFILLQYFTNKDLFPKFCQVTLSQCKDLNDMAIFNLETRPMPVSYLLACFNSKISKFFKKVNVGKILRFSFSGNDILIAVEENKTARRKHSFSHGEVGPKTSFSLSEIEKDIALLSEM
ncbi:hypothetical protein ABPG72_015181 [Tetrahymena utriculariae]